MHSVRYVRTVKILLVEAVLVVELAEDTHGLSLCLTVEHTALAWVLATGRLWSRFEVDGDWFVFGANSRSLVGLLGAVGAV